MVTTLRVGVVGYSTQPFDQTQALRLIRQAFDTVVGRYPQATITVVSGLTNLGVPRLGYEEAARRGWRTAGVTLEYRLHRQDPLFPVDERIIVVGRRGDDSPIFLATIHVLVRIGGGPLSLAETAAFKQVGRPVIEYDLATLTA